MFVAVLSGTLGAACTWSLGYLDSQSNGNVDAGNSSSSASADGFAADNAVPGVDASDSDDAASDGGTGDGAPVNLIVNPSCENATFGWTTVSGTPLSSSTTFAHTGVNHSCYSSMRIDGYAETNYPNSAYDGPMQDITDAVSGGHYYSFNAWVLWAPPGAMPPPPPPDAAAADAAGDDAAVAGDGSVADAAGAPEDGAANEAGTTNAPEEVYATAKETCGDGGVVSYVAIVTVQGVPQETWTQLTTSSGGLQIPQDCTQVLLYIGGPNIGMDLYTDQASLTFVQ